MSPRTMMCLIAALPLLAGACGDPEQPAAAGQISVTGSGLAKAEPDIALISFGVDVTASDPAEAVSQAGSMINSAAAAVLAAGISADDMSTQSYSLWIEDVYDPVTYQYTGEKIYHVSQYETLVVRDLSTVGGVLSTLVGAGVNTISGVSFQIEDQSSLYDGARQAALEDAVRRAESIAEGLGVTLGDAIYVSEYGGGYTEFDQTMASGETYAAYADFSSVPTMTPGTYSVSASVTVTFAIE